MDKLDHPIVFALVLTIIVLAIAHLMHWMLLKAGSTAGAGFFSLP